jgi:CRISPR-associated protein Csx10
MNALTFNIHLLEPLLAARGGGGDPNSAVGFDYIPGSVIRGALIARYLQGKQLDAGNEDFRRLFFDGAVRFLNAYIRSQTGKRTLPAPLSWYLEKDTEKPVYDAAVDDSFINMTGSGTVWKPVSNPYCWIRIYDKGKQQTEFYNPAAQIKIHTARADRQKVTEGESTIFRYLALDAGQTFAGVILADDISDINSIKNILYNGLVFSMGKSHLAGYGRVKIDNVMEHTEWKEYETLDYNTEGSITVTLLSDAIVRGSKTGAYTASIDPVLHTAHENAHVRTCIRGGFNRTWNLPLPQILAVRAGSVFVYEYDPGLLSRLQALEASGIGEKREDGFGRIAVNWNQEKIINMEENLPFSPSHVELEGKSADFAGRMVHRMMRARLDQALIRTVNRLSIEGKDIHNTQLSRMRVAARCALNENNNRRIIKHLDDMKSTARTQFQGAWIERMPLDEWLRLRVNDLNSIWDILNVRHGPKPSVGGIEPALTVDLALEYTVRLIDGILNKELKRRRNNE